jgi:hypothetical protein
VNRKKIRSQKSRVKIGILTLDFLFLAFLAAGCVPSPDENASIPPKVTDLHNYFIPQTAGKSYLWHLTSSTKDSLFFINYSGWDYTKTPQGLLPISHLGISDTVKKNLILNEAYISDSLIRVYYGAAADSATQSFLLFHDTLRIGAKWVCADNFITANGAPIGINAEVTDYFPTQKSVGVIYNDVFVVSYTSVMKGTVVPLEPQYQNNSHIDKYFARNIGEILEFAKDVKGNTLWTSELLETRNR